MSTLFNNNIGQHRQQMVVRFVVALRNVWGELQQKGRSSDISLEGRFRIHQAVGAIGPMWTLMEVLDVRRFPDPVEATAELFKLMSLPGVRASLCEQAGLFLSMLVSRRKALLDMSKKDRLGDGMGCKEAAKLLESCFMQIVRTGVLSEMPNTQRAYSFHPAVLNRYCGLLCKTWETMQSKAEASKDNAQLQLLLGRVTGLGVFDGVRAQLQDGTAVDSGDLVNWYLSSNQRAQRGFFAVVGLGVHELVAIADELGKAALTANKAEKKAFRNAETAVRKIVDIFATGILSVFAI